LFADCLLHWERKGSSKAALSNVREQYDLLFQSRLQIVEACNGVCVEKTDGEMIAMKECIIWRFGCGVSNRVEGE
jgi:hypothetical protein